jgi:polysaccharide pyruvyl transferase CsaB
MSNRVLLAGYYGFDNLGDELILQVLLQQLSDSQVTVLSHDPAKTQERYGVRCLQRMNPFDLVEAFSSADVFVFGGGGLFQDATSWQSVLYYWGLTRFARYFEVPVVFFSQGIGPLRLGLSRLLTRQALQDAALITVRDDTSAHWVTQLTGFTPERTADPVWLYQLPNADPINGSTWRVGLSLRAWPSLTPSAIGQLAAFFQQLTTKSSRPVTFLLLPFQPELDREPLTLFAQAVQGFATCEWANDIPVQIQQCQAVFGMRFHAVLLSILAGVPVLGLSYDPKVQSLLSALGLAGVPVDQLDRLSIEDIQAYFSSYQQPDIHPYQDQAFKTVQRLRRMFN